MLQTPWEYFLIVTLLFPLVCSCPREIYSIYHVFVIIFRHQHPLTRSRSHVAALLWSLCVSIMHPTLWIDSSRQANPPWAKQEPHTCRSRRSATTLYRRTHPVRPHFFYNSNHAFDIVPVIPIITILYSIITGFFSLVSQCMGHLQGCICTSPQARAYLGWLNVWSCVSWTLFKPSWWLKNLSLQMFVNLWLSWRWLLYGPVVLLDFSFSTLVYPDLDMISFLPFARFDSFFNLAPAMLPCCVLIDEGEFFFDFDLTPTGLPYPYFYWLPNTQKLCCFVVFAWLLICVTSEQNLSCIYVQSLYVCLLLWYNSWNCVNC